MKKSKSMASILGILMIVQLPLLGRTDYVIHRSKLDVLDSMLSAFLGSVAFSLGLDLANYLKSWFKPLNPSLFEFVNNKDLTDTFGSVIGNDKAKESFQEIISYLNNPIFFLSYGLKAPRGVLLYGDPGNGKTMLARAVAKEAGCNFIAIGASELESMYIGQGAAKVKALFNLARAKNPCIIFIDEIDAVGQNRANRRYVDVINQLLVEMDGFKRNDRVVVIAATNIPQILDPALLRAGRFDRKIEVTAPEQRDRIILFKHLLGTMSFKLDISDEQFNKLGVMTDGFSGADITHICNEAGLYAMRNKKGSVTLNDLIDVIKKDIAIKGTMLAIPQ